jgi:beta-xylosidase
MVLAFGLVLPGCQQDGGGDDSVPEEKPIPKPISMITAAIENPLIWADVPDISFIRAKGAYYMTSTTMHMNPGVPVMKSYDLVNWRIISYCYDTFADSNRQNLVNGEHEYGYGSWASSIRYHKGYFYVAVFSQSAGKTVIFYTKDPEKEPWQRSPDITPYTHDQTLVFDKDDRVYLIYSDAPIQIRELEPDLSGWKAGSEPSVILTREEIDAVVRSGDAVREGAQMYIKDGKYYLFLISGNILRSVSVYRSDNIHGPYEGKLVLRQDMDFQWENQWNVGSAASSGVAQGTIVDTPYGDWYGIFFQDHGAVGRIPILVPMTWSEDGWPVFGAPADASFNPNDPKGRVGIVPWEITLKVMENPEHWNNLWDSDDFDGPTLPLTWQWNHNPDNSRWSLTERPGYLRLTTGALADNVLMAKNTLTQRTFGPKCAASVKLDVSNMKAGDAAGFIALQRDYGLVSVEMNADGSKEIVMKTATGALPGTIVEEARIPFTGNTVYFKITCDFGTRKLAVNNKANFYYSLDGTDWKPIGKTDMKMLYTLIQQFMGYRFGLFNYATQEAGGYVDFDYFHLEDF